MGTELLRMHQNQARVAANPLKIDIERSQEAIYQFLLELVKTQPPEEVLREFRALFFEYSAHPGNTEAIQALADILAANSIQDFIHTLKRCCYILINNWETKRNHACIQQLIEDFSYNSNRYTYASPILNRLKSWLKTFRDSKDYQDLKLYTNKYLKVERQTGDSERHWSDRYTSYLLVPQYANTNNPKEQRDAALALSKQLKDKFKFDLAMYTTRSQLMTYKNKQLENPTNLGEDVLRLIKKIIAKKGDFSYVNLANIFLKQVQHCCHKDFKKALQNYLFFLTEHQNGIAEVKKKLSTKMQNLYREYEEEEINHAIVLRTCKRTIDFLTTETGKEPSDIFIYLWFQGNPVVLVILLLKLVLVCPSARTHLETRIAELIEHYQKLPEEDCRWAVSFFEIFKIAFAIYADKDVQYNLIKVREDRTRDDNVSEDAILDSYCIFSQCRSYFSPSSSWSDSHQIIPESYPA